MRNILIAMTVLGVSACGQGDKSSSDADRGRLNFVDQGCVICHSVNGVGGTVAPALDAEENVTVDPADLAARMLNGAYAMAALQKAELGYTIDLSAQELRDISAFVGSPSSQRQLEFDDLPMTMRDALLTEVFWDAPDLSNFVLEEEQAAGGDGEE